MDHFQEILTTLFFHVREFKDGFNTGTDAADRASLLLYKRLKRFGPSHLVGDAACHIFECKDVTMPLAPLAGNGYEVHIQRFTFSPADNEGNE